MIKAELTKSVISIKRIAYVTKGGRQQRVSALVVVGDQKGNVGFGLGKSKEAKRAIEQGMLKASNKMFFVSLFKKRTVHHDITCKFGATKLMIRSAPRGTGLVASGTIKTILKTIGFQDIVVKVFGSNNPHNVLKALLKGLLHIQSLKNIAQRRNGSNINGRAIQDFPITNKQKLPETQNI